MARSIATAVVWWDVPSAGSTDGGRIKIAIVQLTSLSLGSAFFIYFDDGVNDSPGDEEAPQ